MSEKNQKELFVDAFSKGNINALYHLLDDTICYFGASKKQFFKKLEQTFQHLKNADENFPLKISKHTKIPNCYYFYSSGWKYAIQIFIDEYEGKVSRLYNKVKITGEEDEHNIHHLDLIFYTDERRDFTFSPAYKKLRRACHIAHKEINNEHVTLLTYPAIKTWLKKHAALYKEVEHVYDYAAYINFKALYDWLNFIDDTFKHYDKVCEAFEVFQEYDFLTIAMKYEEYRWLYFITHPLFCTAEVPDYKNKRIKIFGYNNIYLCGNEAIDFYTFNKIFEHHYWVLENYM